MSVVAIGVSTGGPAALEAVLGSLPRDLGVPIVVVQHIPPYFAERLAQRFQTLSPLDVRIGTHQLAVLPNTVYIAPGGYHTVVTRGNRGVELLLNQDPPENFCQPSVDVLFRSVADVFGPGALGIVMTGMGKDGLLGSREIRNAGGEIWAQDERSSVVWGMPGSVVQAGLVERVLALDDLGPAIRRRVQQAERATNTGR